MYYFDLLFFSVARARCKCRSAVGYGLCWATPSTLLANEAHHRSQQVNVVREGDPRH